MNDFVEVCKSDGESLVPSIWRGVLSEVVDRFVGGDFSLSYKPDSVEYISDKDSNHIEKSVAAYGERLVSLPDIAWETSVCRWMGRHWDVLVDLFTTDGISDLAMFVKVYENNGSYKFEIDSVHVP